jgi:ribosomal protein L44E
LELNSKTREKAAATAAATINNNENINKKFLNNKKQQLNYLCIKCKKHFLNKINLETHTNNSTCMETEMTKLEDDNDDVEIIYACNTCDFKCLIKENLIDHIRKLHDEKLKTTTIDSKSGDNLKLEIKGEAIKPNNSIKRRLLSPTKSQQTQNPQSTTTIIQNSNVANNKFVSLLISLATNDGYEQYVCGLCPYVCYHLPSLKSHMWTHVTNRKFDYSLNTTIINAALDYENKLNRQLLSYNDANDASATPFNDLANPYELINYPLSNKISQHSTNNNEDANEGSSDKPMVSFRCSKCGYSTINLSLLRLHKRQHYIKIITPNATSKIQNLSKINDKETQKLVINS